jgi:hypothetical protein
MRWLPRPVDALFGIVLLFLVALLGGGIVLCLVAPAFLISIAVSRGDEWHWTLAALSMLSFLCATLVLSNFVALMRDWWKAETPVYRVVRLVEETAAPGWTRRYARAFLSKHPQD